MTNDFENYRRYYFKEFGFPLSVDQKETLSMFLDWQKDSRPTPAQPELAHACPNCQGVNGYKLQDGTIYNCPACGQPEASQSG